MLLSRLALPLIFASVGTLGGCYASAGAGTEPVYATTEVTAAPVGIETAPTATYENRTVYLYQDHWYYRDRGRWSYYREEPPQLRQRHYVQSAPPARGHVEERREERHEEHPTSAPPARRVD